MLFNSPSTVLVGALGCISFLSQQAYAAHIPYRHRHSQHSPGGFHQPAPPVSACAAGAPAATVTVTTTTVVTTTLAAEDIDASSTVLSIITPTVVPASDAPVATSSSSSSSSSSSAFTSVVTVSSASSSASASTSVSTAVPASSSGSSTSKAKVIIPYYLYPSTGAWTPLEELIVANSDVQFTIIINPDNGPGSSTASDENFLAAVPRLASYGNALVLGYVSTQKGTRDISEVEKDIQTYAAWPSISGKSSFAVHGIFLDEAATDYNADTVTYYKNLASTIKQSDGLGPDNYIVTNPGAVPDESYLDIPDSTVIFESAYSEFQSAYSANEFEKIKGLDLSRFATMVYDIPSDTDLSTLITQLRSISSHTYMSNLDTYQAYDSLWSTVVSLLAA
ncbi:Spherulation-specific family 4-domain-containing protein [Aspergillus pseudotamarii]|uniref:Spherulation-specific family 4-domain-containing protein n=1 Tax=Aspergillus pseudotamarii TaxID=132259 RepID=A0A5N6SYZ6_ASPPS|nr:Spherulation-specific family 4-domain-containing protein [Aspergillus pseudotamarii]KAE8139908.1 Spherulation-specific family 4-domain-containing protein [Aspergillus pseudotamarii]